jgi:hypothetical protein
MRGAAYVSLVLSIAFAGISPIFFKLAVLNIGGGPSLSVVRAFLTNRYALAGLTLYALSSILWLFSLYYIEVSLMYHS